MERIKLASGNYLDLHLASIDESIDLFQIIIGTFKLNGIEIKIDRNTELNFIDIFEKNSSSFLGGLMDILSSKKVLESVIKCSSRCIYEINGVKQKVLTSSFEDTREDFFEVIKLVALGNLKPFFPKPHSK